METVKAIAPWVLLLSLALCATVLVALGKATFDQVEPIGSASVFAILGFATGRIIKQKQEKKP